MKRLGLFFAVFFIFASSFLVLHAQEAVKGFNNDLYLLTTVKKKINDSFVGHVPEGDTLIYAALKAMVNALNDPYSQFRTPEEVRVRHVNEPVYWKLMGDGIAYIKIPNFLEEADSTFEKAAGYILDTLSHYSHPALIIDLRNNPGGYVSVVGHMLSFWRKPGDTFVRTYYRGGDSSWVITTDRKRGFSGWKTVVLMNHETASASELMAGVLQENGAIGVGKPTYGKNVIQSTLRLSNGCEVSVTYASWTTPRGISVSDSGLTPTFLVEEDEARLLLSGIDVQLEKALKLCKD